jgi:hypothetical protein
MFNATAPRKVSVRASCCELDPVRSILRVYRLSTNARILFVIPDPLLFVIPEGNLRLRIDTMYMAYRAAYVRTLRGRQKRDRWGT